MLEKKMEQIAKVFFCVEKVEELLANSKLSLLLLEAFTRKENDQKTQLILLENIAYNQLVKEVRDEVQEEKDFVRTQCSELF